MKNIFTRFRNAFDAVIAILVCLVCIRTGYAAAGADSASFLTIPVGAGPAALGSAYTALATDAYAPIWNPAGLGFLDSTQMAGQYLSYLQSINYEFISVVHPLRPGDSLGLSAQYLGSGDIAGTDTSGNPTGNYSDTFGAYSLAYGHAFTDKLSFGFTGKIIHVTLDDVSASAYAADVGTLYKVTDQFNLAAVVANLGSKLTFLSNGDSLPLTFRFGGAYRPLHQWMLTSEADVPASGPAGWHMGVEWRPLDLIAIRAGYRTDTTQQLGALAGFSTGIGMNVWGQELAYAWVPYGDLGDTQYFSVLVRFGAEDAKKGNLSQPQSSMKPGRAPHLAQGLEGHPAPEDKLLVELLNAEMK